MFYIRNPHSLDYTFYGVLNDVFSIIYQKNFRYSDWDFKHKYQKQKYRLNTTLLVPIKSIVETAHRIVSTNFSSNPNLSVA